VVQNTNGCLIGIDLGTTFSAVAYLDDEGKPVPIVNSEGSTTLPSVVWFEEGRVWVGSEAKRRSLIEPQCVVSEIKREMGNWDYGFPYRGQRLSAEAISAMILKKLKQEAEARIGSIRGAVISVPFYFDDTRRKATEDAGRIAGLNVVDLVNEPVAATLCYAYGRGQMGRTSSGKPQESDPDPMRPVLVYDLGGGTFDVAYVMYNSRRFQVVGTDGDVRLGGTDWTRRLVDFVADKFLKRHGFDLRQQARSHQMLLQQCDDAKHALSERLRFTIPVRWDGKELDIEIHRDDFEAMTADLLLRTETTTREVLDESKVSWDDLADIVLVGGSARMPMIRKMLERTSGWLSYSGLPPGEAIAMGAAIHAEIACRRGAEAGAGDASTLGQIDQITVNAHSLGIAVLDRQRDRLQTKVMIPRNSPLPCSVTRRFRTVASGQRAALVRVLEGESSEPEGCVQIGHCRLDQMPSGLPAGAPVEVSYCYQSNGRVHVAARDLIGGRQVESEIFHREGLKQNELELFRDFVASVPVA